MSRLVGKGVGIENRRRDANATADLSRNGTKSEEN